MSKTLTIKDSYENYIMNTKDDNPVSKKEFVELCRLHNRFMMNKILEGHKVLLPYRLGEMYIYGHKEKIDFEDGKIVGLSPNWRETKELWDSNPEAKKKKQLVYNTNEHSSGYRYRFVWSKTTANMKNKTLYILRITREYKRELSKRIFNGQEY